MAPTADARSPLARTIATLTAELERRRTAAGHWDGHLSSSALSTATAVVALTIVERSCGPRDADLIESGLAWLVAHQNADGGWGDTTISFSNLSTTALCWAALAREGRPATAARQAAAVQRAEAWMANAVGGLDAARLGDAVVARYGKDRTFSVPILTTLALTGRLGSDRSAWRRIPQLPFELAACPHQWFQWLRLPVVSYALPALIALGQVHHRHAPTGNPLLRRVREAVIPRTLQVLLDSQPESGGYLEATPLTSFVLMSLAAAGGADGPVARRAVRFLQESAREDGSWPIDTNLATWVTTLGINAHAPEGLPARERDALVDWLLGQQHREEHPFTHAAPGGWAWTPLSGGVPDADDTAGALIAIRTLGRERADVRRAAEAGVGWLLGLQNRDGGIPTFCRGWGALPFDRSGADLTAHALEAWGVWHDAMPDHLQQAVTDAGRRAVRYLAARQDPDGSWCPLWFGNQHTADENNPTYGTARVLLSLATPFVATSFDTTDMRRRGAEWLTRVQNADGGWGGGPGAPSSIEETGLALQASARVLAMDAGAPGLEAARRGVGWMLGATDEGRRAPASPIGLYFARLWYFEEFYPLVFALGGLVEMQSTLEKLPPPQNVTPTCT